MCVCVFVCVYFILRLAILSSYLTGALLLSAGTYGVRVCFNIKELGPFVSVQLSNPSVLKVRLTFNITYFTCRKQLFNECNSPFKQSFVKEIWIAPWETWTLVETGPIAVNTILFMIHEQGLFSLYNDFHLSLCVLCVILLDIVMPEVL